MRARDRGHRSPPTPRTRGGHLVRSAALCGLLFTTTTSHAAGTLEIFRAPAGGSTDVQATAVALSADGSAAILHRWPSVPGALGTNEFWDVDGRVTEIPGPPGAAYWAPLGSSSDGERVYLESSLGIHTWSPAEGHALYPVSSPTGNLRRGALEFSSQTETVAGVWQDASGWQLAFWSVPGGLRIVPDTLSGRPYTVESISADGAASFATRVGDGPGNDSVLTRESGVEWRHDYDTSDAYLYLSDDLLILDGTSMEQLSEHGDTIYGVAFRLPSGSPCLVRWSFGREPECLLDLVARGVGYFDEIGTRGVAGPLSVSADGSTVIGWEYWTDSASGPVSSFDDYRFQNYVWQEVGGERTVEAWLEDEHAIDLQGLRKLMPAALSQSGRVLVGSAIDADGDHVAFRAILDPACSDGFDNDGDGNTDFPADPGCASADDGDEARRHDVAIDLLPRRHPNRVLISQPVRVTVSILGSDSLDVGDVDVDTLRFGPAGAAPQSEAGRPFARGASTRDVNGDGHPDLSVVFVSTQLGLAFGDVQICLTGEGAGDAFEACDSVVPVIPGCGEDFVVACLVPIAWVAGRRFAGR